MSYPLTIGGEPPRRPKIDHLFLFANDSGRSGIVVLGAAIPPGGKQLFKFDGKRWLPIPIGFLDKILVHGA